MYEILYMNKIVWEAMRWQQKTYQGIVFIYILFREGLEISTSTKVQDNVRPNTHNMPYKDEKTLDKNFGCSSRVI